MSKHHQIGDRPMTPAERQARKRRLDKALIDALTAENARLRRGILAAVDNIGEECGLSQEEVWELGWFGDDLSPFFA